MCFLTPNDNPLLRFFNSAVVGLSATALTTVLAGFAVYGLTRFPFVLSLSRMALITIAALLAAAAALSSGWMLRSSLAVISALALLVAARFGGAARAAIGGNGVLIGILASRILPPVVIVLPLYVMAQRMGVLDTRSILILTYTAANLPVAVWLLLAVLGRTATDLEEAAQLDGASHFRILFQVVAPDGGRRHCCGGASDLRPVLERIPLFGLSRGQSCDDDASLPCGPNVRPGAAGGLRRRGMGASIRVDYFDGRAPRRMCGICATLPDPAQPLGAGPRVGAANPAAAREAEPDGRTTRGPAI